MTSGAKKALKNIKKKAKGFHSKGGKSTYPNTVNSPVHQILSLQQTIGNRTVQRLFNSGHIQTKLKIGQPNDACEQEADLLAEKVMHMQNDTVISGQKTSIKKKNEFIQKRSTFPFTNSPLGKEEEKPVQKKSLPLNITPFIQRQPKEEQEKEKLVQAKPLSKRIIPFAQCQEEEEKEKEVSFQTNANFNKMPEINTSLETRVNILKGKGKSLPKSEQDFFSPRFGYDFSEIRIHNYSNAADIAKSINARAFTVGNNIVFGQGQYNPATNYGRILLGHELAHVIQQNNIASGRFINSKLNINNLYGDRCKTKVDLKGNTVKDKLKGSINNKPKSFIMSHQLYMKKERMAQPKLLIQLQGKQQGSVQKQSKEFFTVKDYKNWLLKNIEEKGIKILVSTILVLCSEEIETKKKASKISDTSYKNFMIALNQVKREYARRAIKLEKDFKILISSMPLNLIEYYGDMEDARQLLAKKFTYYDKVKAYLWMAEATRVTQVLKSVKALQYKKATLIILKLIPNILPNLYKTTIEQLFKMKGDQRIDAIVKSKTIPNEWKKDLVVLAQISPSLFVENIINPVLEEKIKEKSKEIIEKVVQLCKGTGRFSKKELQQFDELMKFAKQLEIEDQVFKAIYKVEIQVMWECFNNNLKKMSKDIYHDFKKLCPHEAKKFDGWLAEDKWKGYKDSEVLDQEFANMRIWLTKRYNEIVAFVTPASMTPLKEHIYLFNNTIRDYCRKLRRLSWTKKCYKK